MGQSNCCDTKLSQSNIGGRAKPFIDRNLQIQVPSWDVTQSSNSNFHSPIYSHYMGSSPSHQVFSQINESDLSRAMEEAKCSFEAWHKMQRKIQEAFSARSS